MYDYKDFKAEVFKEENQTEHSHVFSLIIISFLEYLQLKDIKKYKPKGLTIGRMQYSAAIFNHPQWTEERKELCARRSPFHGKE